MTFLTLWLRNLCLLFQRMKKILRVAQLRSKLRFLRYYLFNKKPQYYQKVRSYGLNLAKREREVIVSLTSYPGRINTLSCTIETLLVQTFKPDQVILWLADSQFPNKEDDLPQSLLRLKQYGLTIGWYKDIRSYKKLIPTLKAYPNAMTITADDDVYYHPDWLKTLYDSYLENPHAVHAHCVRNIHLTSSQESFAPYSSWEHDTTTGDARSSALQIGVGGVLYPPHCFHSDILNEYLFVQLAPNADDLWFWAMSILANTPIVRVKNAMMPAVNYRASTAESLCKQNLEGGANNVQLRNLATHYPELIQIVRQDLLKL